MERGAKYFWSSSEECVSCGRETTVTAKDIYLSKLPATGDKNEIRDLPEVPKGYTIGWACNCGSCQEFIDAVDVPVHVVKMLVNQESWTRNRELQIYQAELEQHLRNSTGWAKWLLGYIVCGRRT